ncbi:hypothetical protein K435DRAFT_836993 [Dendrothele bispora CBS 962.96]|uniref:Protein kinase domain-containing protein n=1 Tax=Dendrothele bispora (strain CBS 962.96) TaxID=1314807 RepID=A0A4S8MF10_DENBC|nr:hypothetical protein K435DRAFT_836993 [Dendrothele bispora CBS 962.96]
MAEEFTGLEQDELSDKGQRILFYQQEPANVRGSLTRRSTDLAVLGDRGRHDELQAAFGESLSEKDLVVHWDEMKRLGGVSLVRSAADVKSKFVLGNVDQHSPNDVPTSDDTTSETAFSMSTSKTIESTTWPRASSTGGGSPAISADSDTLGRRSGTKTSKRARGSDGLPFTNKRTKGSGMSSASALDSDEAADDFYDEELETSHEMDLAETVPSVLREEVQLQIAGYALEFLSGGVLRSHTIGMVVDTNEIQLGYYDHSGILLSQPFSVKTDEFHFLATLYHLRALSGSGRGIVPLLKRSPLNLKNYPPRDFLPVTNIYTSADITLGRASEASLLWLASKTAKQNSDWHWVERHLPGLKFWMDKELVSGQDDFPQQRIKAFLDEHCPQFDYEERILRVLVQDKLYPLTDLRVEAQYAQVFCDVLQAHRWLYDHARILHRDISMHNIMFRKVGDEIFGVLNDLDLSSPLTNRPSATSKHRTGTRPFIAHQLQHPTKKVTPLYRHDLESLFYVMLCLTCRYTLDGREIRSPPYEDWYTAPDHIVSGLKRNIVTDPDPLDPPVTSGFSGFKQILVDIKQLLLKAFGVEILAAEIFADPEQFDRETAGGRFTYEEFLKILKQFDGKELTVRYSRPEPLPGTPFDESTEEENQKMMKATMGQWLGDDLG